jgi:hypothetical protein
MWHRHINRKVGKSMHKLFLAVLTVMALAVTFGAAPVTAEPRGY